jgi:hypothetical protein
MATAFDTTRYRALADSAFEHDYPTRQTAGLLEGELFCQRAVQFETLPKAKWYPDRQWLAHVRNGGDDFRESADNVYFEVSGADYDATNEHSGRLVLVGDGVRRHDGSRPGQRPGVPVARITQQRREERRRLGDRVFRSAPSKGQRKELGTDRSGKGWSSLLRLSTDQSNPSSTKRGFLAISRRLEIALVGEGVTMTRTAFVCAALPSRHVSSATCQPRVRLQTSGADSRLHFGWRCTGR